MDYSELIFSEDFKAYRKKQLTEIVRHINGIIRNGLHNEVRVQELKGVLDITAKIIRLPSKLVNKEKYAEKLNKEIQADLIDISTFLVREYLKEIE